MIDILFVFTLLYIILFMTSIFKQLRSIRSDFDIFIIDFNERLGALEEKYKNLEKK